MPQMIEDGMVSTRLCDLGQTTINQTVSLFKGGIFALAAVLLLEVAFAPEHRPVLFVLWGASFLLTVTSYNAHINTSLIAFRESVAAIVVVIVQMMSELLLFAVLTPRAGFEPWHFWPFVVAAFQVVTAFRLFFPLNSGLQFSEKLQPLIDAFEVRRKAGAWRMMAVLTVALIIGATIAIMPPGSAWPDWLAGLLGLGVMAFAGYGLVSMHEQRRMVETMLDHAR